MTMMIIFRVLKVQCLLALLLPLLSTVIHAGLPEQAVIPHAVDAPQAEPNVLLSITPTVAPGSKLLADNPDTWLLHAEQWELARSGDILLSQPVINHVIKTWLSDKQKKIEIRYPGGEAGEFWVQQLRDWLVALGIPSKNMVTSPGSGADDVIKFAIIR